MISRDSKAYGNLAKLAATLGFLVLFKALKFNWIVGSLHAFFSAINICAPFTVVFGGAIGGVTGLLVGLLSTGKFVLVSTGLPALLAGLYWRSTNKIVRLGLPLGCMFLFWLQTGLTLAAFYPLLWLIPIIIGLFSPKQLYLRAFGATWIAHAVGSVIWASWATITPWQWFALIPVAFFERVVMAGGMLYFYQSMVALEKLVLFSISRQCMDNGVAKDLVS